MTIARRLFSTLIVPEVSQLPQKHLYYEEFHRPAIAKHRPAQVPEKFDLQTGLITCRVKKVFRIQIRFQGSEIRRG